MTSLAAGVLASILWLAATPVLAQTAPAAAAASAPESPAAPERVAAKPGAERLQVADPYIELRTGAGRGYPIFHVAARGEWIEILLRSTDWYRVRTANGREGWVNRRQLETTLTEAGEKKSFRDLLLDDYLERRVQVGAAYGRFHHEPVIEVQGNYRLSSTLSLDGGVGQVQGTFSGTDLWRFGVQLEPWSEKRFSPFVGIGLGRLTNVPNRTLVNAVTVRAKLAYAGIGARYYVSDRFLLRADVNLTTATLSDNRTDEYRSATLGLAFFF